MDKEPEKKDQPSSKESFNSTARGYAAASGIGGGMIMCTIFLAVWQHTDSKLWLVGAAAGVLATIGSFYDLYRMSKESADKPKPPETRPDDKPDFKP